ncbi:hypothetical protein L1049_020805 [Liquidambar formosana]|uniref:Uncharacterized protein n=1 Tax=Liquidambar formosana TaxID=63359 RepID=A0AAP0XAZ3_LIQFO
MMGVLWVVVMDGMNAGTDEDGTVVVVVVVVLAQERSLILRGIPDEEIIQTSAEVMGKKQRGKPSKRENEKGDIMNAKRWTTATKPVPAICKFCRESFDTLEEWRKHTCKVDKKKKGVINCLTIPVKGPNQQMLGVAGPPSPINLVLSNYSF